MIRELRELFVSGIKFGHQVGPVVDAVELLNIKDYTAYLNQEQEWHIEPEVTDDDDPNAAQMTRNYVLEQFHKELKKIINPPNETDGLQTWPVRLSITGKDRFCFQQLTQLIAQKRNLEVVDPEIIVREAIEGRHTFQ